MSDKYKFDESLRALFDRLRTKAEAECAPHDYAGWAALEAAIRGLFHDTKPVHNGPLAIVFKRPLYTCTRCGTTAPAVPLDVEAYRPSPHAAPDARGFTMSWGKPPTWRLYAPLETAFCLPCADALDEVMKGVREEHVCLRDAAYAAFLERKP
jgi:hypothetical protein